MRGLGAVDVTELDEIEVMRLKESNLTPQERRDRQLILAEIKKDVKEPEKKGQLVIIKTPYDGVSLVEKCIAAEENMKAAQQYNQRFYELTGTPLDYPHFFHFKDK